MAHATLPEADAVLLTRAFGLLVSQAGVYGAQHNVTQGTARSVFAEMEQALKTFGPIEFAVSANMILINGLGCGIAAAAGKNLFDRMSLYKVGGILFTPPLDQREFLFCLNLFSTPPNVLAAQGGFEAVLKRAGLRSIKVASVSYQRVTGDAPAVAPDTSKTLFPRAEPVAPRPAEPVKPVRPDVLDLSAAWTGTTPTTGSAADTDDLGRSDETPSGSSRRLRATTLAAMLRSAAEALERRSDHDTIVSSQKVAEALDQIRDALSEMAAVSQRDISLLARQVEEDRKTIDSIEVAARRRGIGLKLTRGELIQRYAELNQEIIQPLTVSTSVIDMLASGHTGKLTESQRDLLLKMAAESVERVNQLVAYMNRISGLPDTYTPDRSIIAETYR